MVIHKSTSEKVFDVFNALFMIGLIIITIYPLYYVIMASISDPKQLLRHEGFIFLPLGQATLKGYKLTLNNPNILLGYRNTAFYVLVGTLINLFMTSIGSYVVTRKHFHFRKLLLIMMTITMFFNGGLIPLFIVVQTLKIYNTVWAVLLPGAVSVWNLLIMKTFFEGIPASMEESAIIDGAGDWSVYWKIILPLSKPVIAVMVLFYGVGHWNEWFYPMIFLRDRGKFPLQLFLREILVLNQSSGATKATAENMMEESYFKELIRYCTIIAATVPILCVYPFLQKYFVQGVMIGAIKG